MQKDGHVRQIGLDSGMQKTRVERNRVTPFSLRAFLVENKLLNKKIYNIDKIENRLWHVSQIYIIIRKIKNVFWRVAQISYRN